ncbi:hypothetical protein BHE74_00052449 [Ensete ventricosum]|nr:hypothetical protein BHE74_00052449 [Ensete ventricosum]
MSRVRRSTFTTFVFLGSSLPGCCIGKRATSYVEMGAIGSYLIRSGLVHESNGRERPYRHSQVGGGGAVRLSPSSVIEGNQTRPPLAGEPRLDLVQISIEV